MSAGASWLSATVAATVVLTAGSVCATEVRILDLSGCIHQGGRVICPDIAPPALTVLSTEQFEALQKARPLDQNELDEAKKALLAK